MIVVLKIIEYKIFLQNYRFINFLSTMSKINERVIEKKIETQPTVEHSLQ